MFCPNTLFVFSLKGAVPPTVSIPLSIRRRQELRGDVAAPGIVKAGQNDHLLLLFDILCIEHGGFSWVYVFLNGFIGMVKYGIILGY